MLNTMIENEIKVFTNISVFLLRSWSQIMICIQNRNQNISKTFTFVFEILVKLLLSFWVFAFDMMKLLAILKVKGTLMQI